MQATDVLGDVVFEEKGNEELCFIYFAHTRLVVRIGRTPTQRGLHDIQNLVRGANQFQSLRTRNHRLSLQQRSSHESDDPKFNCE